MILLKIPESDILRLLTLNYCSLVYERYRLAEFLIHKLNLSYYQNDHIDLLFKAFGLGLYGHIGQI